LDKKKEGGGLTYLLGSLPREGKGLGEKDTGHYLHRNKAGYAVLKVRGNGFGEGDGRAQHTKNEDFVVRNPGGEASAGPEGGTKSGGDQFVPEASSDETWISTAGGKKGSIIKRGVNYLLGGDLSQNCRDAAEFGSI